MEENFLTALAQARPDPGGGAAAAHGALLALALAEKIARLELKRPGNDQEGRELWESQLKDVRRLKENLAALQEADVKAYAGLARARQEKQGLEEALQEAIDCPVRIMAGAAEALELVAAAGQCCRAHLIADLKVACEFLGAASMGAFHIASANLPGVVSGEARFAWMARLTELSRQGQERLAQVRRILSARAASPGGP